MTLREWCKCTYNVFDGYTVITIYQENDPPIRTVAGFIPDEIALKQVQSVGVKKAGEKTAFFEEVEAVLKG